MLNLNKRLINALTCILQKSKKCFTEKEIKLSHEGIEPPKL